MGLMHVIRPGQSTGGDAPDVSTTRKHRIEMVAADGRVEKMPLPLLVVLHPDGSEILYIGQSGGELLITEARVIFQYTVVPHKINKNGWGARPPIDVVRSSDQMFAGHLWLAQIVEMQVDVGTAAKAVPQMIIIAEEPVRNPGVEMIVQLASRSISDLLTAANALSTGVARARGLVPPQPFVRLDEPQSRRFDDPVSAAWNGPAVWVGSPEWAAAMNPTSTSASASTSTSTPTPTSRPGTSLPPPPAGPAPLPPPASARPAAAPVLLPPPPPPVQLPPAQWSPDPFGRHQLRYWDGAVWTEHVSTNGVSATDPAA
ncbi:MAG: hypothetical protein JWN62_419 [Acidimicrobiales bacterium]|nr:hypothetical protein [Acidimicrobiales bacterium]